jgi:hypothetical protein
VRGNYHEAVGAEEISARRCGSARLHTDNARGASSEEQARSSPTPSNRTLPLPPPPFSVRCVHRECNSGGGGTENGFSLLLRLGGAREGVRDVGVGATGGGG